MTVANTIIWLIYALLKRDPYIAAPNAIGATLAIFISMTAYGLAEEKVGVPPTLPCPFLPLTSCMTQAKVAPPPSPFLLQAKQNVRTILTISFGVLPLLGVLTSFACKDSTAQLNLWYACMAAFGLGFNVMGLGFRVVVRCGGVRDSLVRAVCPPRGAAGNVVSFVYYGAPLSTMAEVIKTKNSASILLPLTIMNIMNWTTYGLVSHAGVCGPHVGW